MPGNRTSLRISLVTETYFPQVNGVSRTLERLVKHCTGQGDRVQLLMPRYKGDEATRTPAVEKVAWGAVHLPFYKEVGIPLARTGMVRQALARFQPDLVHIATEGTLGLAALRASRSLGLPVVSSYHTNFSDFLKSYRASALEPLCWRYLRWFHNRTLATFCPTPSTQRVLKERRFENVGIWGRGVDSHRFHPGKRDHALREKYGVGPDQKLLLYVGRVAGEKNLELLMDAWRALPRRENAQLLIVGDGPLRARLEAMGDPRTIFTGYLYGEQLARIYSSADLFVFPSLTDTFGNVLLEAMASGLPALGFDVQGSRDNIKEGVTGRVLPVVSREALAVAIQDLLDDNECLREMSKAARAYAEQQNWEDILNGLRNTYASFAGNPKALAAQTKLIDHPTF